MDIKVDNREEEKVNVLYFEGSLDASNADEFKSSIVELSQKTGCRLVLSMNGISFISSAGWSALVETCMDLKAAKGDLRLAEMRRTAERIFDLMGLEACLKHYASSAEAVKSYAE
jgi:anti-anti-sigma factor